MADFSSIVQEINQYITSNGKGEITGAILNSVLRDIVSSVNSVKADTISDCSLFGGFVMQDDAPLADKRYFYIAMTAGTYENFSGLTIDGNHAVMFCWEGSRWVAYTLYLSGNGITGLLSMYLRTTQLYQQLGFEYFNDRFVYPEGDIVVYNGLLYMFTSDHMGPWDAEDVIEYSLAQLSNDLIASKADKVDGAVEGEILTADNNNNPKGSGYMPSSFADASAGMPTGGSDGQFLAKSSGTDYDAAWVDSSAIGSIFGGFLTPGQQPRYGNDKRYYYLAKQAGTYFGIAISGRQIAKINWVNVLGWAVTDFWWYSASGLDSTIASAIQAAQVGAAIFKGPVNTGTDISNLTAYSSGYYWVVATAGTYVGQTCEVGDFIFCISDYNSEYSASDFSVVQGNIDRAVVNAKADKVANATSGNFAALDSNGNLTDSGSKASDFIATPSTAGTSGQVLTSDGQGGQYWQTPTSAVSDVTVGGTSVVTNGVAAVPAIPDVTGKADKVNGATNGDFAGLDGNGNLVDTGFNEDDFSLKVVFFDVSTTPSSMLPNKVYRFGTLSGNTTFPAFTAVPSGDTEVKIWCWTFTTPSTAPTITWPAGITAWNGGSAPTINASKNYEVSVMDGIACIIES